MKSLEIVRNFVDEGNKAQLAATKEFSVHDGNKNVDMLGTYSPVTGARLGGSGAEAAAARLIAESSRCSVRRACWRCWRYC